MSGVATAFCIEVLSKYAPTLSSLLIAVADAYITPFEEVESRLVILPTELESPDPIWDSSITTIEFGAMASEASCTTSRANWLYVVNIALNPKGSFFRSATILSLEGCLLSVTIGAPFFLVVARELSVMKGLIRGLPAESTAPMSSRSSSIAG